jgi:hypothetical protein
MNYMNQQGDNQWQVLERKRREAEFKRIEEEGNRLAQKALNNKMVKSASDRFLFHRLI